jgi:hypothetical protein
MPRVFATIRRAGLLLAVLPLAASAQIGLGAGVQAAFPNARLQPSERSGLGAYVKAELGLLLVGVAAEANVTRFTGQTGEQDRTIAGLQVGPRVSLGLIKVGLDAGYFTELDRSGWVPNASLRLGPLEAGVSYTAVGSRRWWALRAGLRR